MSANSYAALPVVSKEDVSQVEPHRITVKQWLRLGVVWLCCTLAAGLIPGQAVFASMLAEAGVYGEICEHETSCDGQLANLNIMLGIGVNIVLLAQLPVGLLFDFYGGSVVGVTGTFICSFGLLLMAIAVYSAQNGTDSHTNWLVPLAAVVTDFGSIMNSYCFYALIWHFPGSTTMILSFSTATYQVSALLPLVLQLVMDKTGMHLGQAFLCFSAVVLLSAPVIWKVTPSQQDFYDQVQKVLGVPLPKPKKSFGLKRLGSEISRAYTAVMLDIKDHLWLCLGFSYAATFTTLYTSMSSAYGKHLFGTVRAGEQLAHMQVITAAVVGAVCAPFVARLADCLGLRRFAWLLTSFICFPVCLFFVPEWWAASVTTGGICLFVTLNSLFTNRYFLHYAPPNRLGAYGGFFYIVCLVFTVPFLMTGYMWIEYSPESQRFFVPFLGTGALGVVCLLAFDIRFCFIHDGKGVPQLPQMLPEDEMELVMPFGAMTLDEASEILSLDKEVLFKRLADPDPQVLKELLSMVNTQKVEEALAQHSPEDMIAMLEAQPEAEEEDDEEDMGGSAPTISAAVVAPDLAGDVEQASGAAEAAISPGTATSQEFASSLCELLRAGSSGSEERTVVLEGDKREPNDGIRFRALGECLDILVREGDVAATKLFLLEVPIEDQWSCFVAMEDWMDEQRQKEMDKKFNKIIPAKVFAGLLKQNPKLKEVVARLMKREIQRSVDRFRGKTK